MPLDDHLYRFCAAPPSSADHLTVTAMTAMGTETLLHDRNVRELRSNPMAASNIIAESCERYARTESREVRFAARWSLGERTLALHQWRHGAEGDGAARPLDGTVESFLQQQQRHAETQHRLYHEGYQMVSDGWKQLLITAQKRIDALERDNEQLRERLRKSNDVEAEIALAHATADLENKGRTAQLIETRLLPIAGALAEKYLISKDAQPSAAPTPPPPNGKGTA